MGCATGDPNPIPVPKPIPNPIPIPIPTPIPTPIPIPNRMAVCCCSLLASGCLGFVAHALRGALVAPAP